MFDFLRRRSQCVGSAQFRGSIPHGIDQLDGLAPRGVTVEPGPEAEDAHWTATLRHPDWGEAQAACIRNPPAFDRQLLELDPRLTESDVGTLLTCGVAITLHMEGERGLVLRDRKIMLRFLEALLGRDGVAAVDHTSQAFWTRQALEDELAHNADLDVESLFTIHAVTEEDETVSWFHTHGLGELGRFDFDILRPDRHFVDNCSDFCRAMAFAIVEGLVRIGEPAFKIGQPFVPIHLLPADEFMQQASPDDAALRDDPSGDHVTDRVVLCDHSSGGGLRRLFGSRNPRPNRAFTRQLPDNIVLNFSTDATNLMAERARMTFPVFREIAREVEEFELPALAKIGYVVDGGEPDQREHLWFMVHEFHEESVDATLVNSPFWIERLNEGDRGVHSVEGLSEWSILTPFGPINPHAFHARRLIRDHRDEMLQMLEESRAEESPAT